LGALSVLAGSTSESDAMKLLIANKNYSSWSLRAWLALAQFDIEFEEEMLLLSGPGWKETLAEKSPTGRVPVLIDGDLAIPETLAIIEYIAEKYPEVRVWPEDRAERALARAAAAEMHAGFTALRNAAPMNLRASYPGRVAREMVADDLRRLEDLLGGFLVKSGGPYLFGTFTGADAMFAPMATRIRTYDLSVSDTLTEYVEAIYALPAFQTWLFDAVREPWIVQEDEIDFIQGKTN
jgi:glutathione S-transferase